MNFLERVNKDTTNLNLFSLEEFLSSEQRYQIQKDRIAWNFYEGFHWEQIPEDGDRPEITENYCRRFVDKFVSFEFGLGFNINIPYEKGKEDSPITDHLNKVWDYNKKLRKCVEIGQSKSITGRSWVQVVYQEKGDFFDPYEEFPNGRIKLTVLPSSLVFPEYNSHDKDVLEKITVAYPVKKMDKSIILRTPKEKTIIERQVWTREKIYVFEGKEQVSEMDNPYGLIPFVQIVNLPVVGKTNGVSDLEDIIPLNTEMNLKKADVSEIIDYHSAPVTIVYGATVSSLDKGANKMWGGLPKDAKVENLSLNTDLNASMNYIASIKKSMHEIGCIPEGSLGSEQAISNTSGIALQITNMPLIERTRVKRMCSSEGLQEINKLILYLSFKYQLVTQPTNTGKYNLYESEVTFPDTLPKDKAMELQNIEAEMRLGLESRTNAMQRLNKENIPQLIKEVDEEKKRQQELFFNVQKGNKNQGQNADGTREKNNDGGEKRLNSGILNGETPNEQQRVQTKGENKK